MVRSAYIATITLTTAWQKLSASSLILDVSLLAFADNAGDMLVRVNGGASASWPAGAQFGFTTVNLATIEVKGEAGDKVTIAGNSPA